MNINKPNDVTLKVQYKNYSQVLNLQLLRKRQREQFKDELVNTYIDMFKIFEKIDNTDNRIELYHLNKSIEPLELKMQELWGFTVSNNHHRYWFECSKCTCPKMDNYDMMGTGLRYTSCECIIHGTKTLNLVNRGSKLKRIIKNK